MDTLQLPDFTILTWVGFIIALCTIVGSCFFFFLYFRMRVKAQLADSDDVASLAARRTQLLADVEAVQQRLKENLRELTQTEGERLQQENMRQELDRLGEEIAQARQELQNKFDQADSAVQELDGIRRTAENTSQEIGRLDAKKEAMVKELEKLKIQIETLKQEEQRYQETVTPLRNELNTMQSTLADTTERYENLQEEVQKKEDARRRLDGLLYTLQEDLEKCRSEWAPLVENIKDLKSKYDQYKTEIASARDTLDGLRYEVQSLQVRKTLLEKELGSQSTAVKEDNDSRYNNLLVDQSDCLNPKQFPAPRSGDETNEYKVLQAFAGSLRDQGYVFSNRVIRAFHTALKCQDINPLTVLAGVSGTGKTLLPIRYAEFMGIHRLVMPVQPRWDSPQDLFGFYNYMEGQYKATELSRSLIRMDPYNYSKQPYSAEMRDHMLLVLLDEMNLARTEYYFSEFLSRLELRRTVENPNDQAARITAEIELDTGPGREKFRIWVPHNVLFVGTMNEDESTQSLSDKVLDRSNVIRFGKPDAKFESLSRSAQTRHENAWLPYQVWQSWQHKPNNNDVWQSAVTKWIIELNEALDTIGRPFGFRVHQAIETYVANYPDREEDSWKMAFADQVEQKILPKIRGVDMNDGEVLSTLDTISTIIKELGDSELDTAFNTSRSESANLGMFHWRGVSRSIRDN
ncbi:MAG: AAA family ATPase [Desulfovibrionaceae bacterium]|nr:AAA family ATPase [Desulfovibrionaceae bacterium]